MADWRTSYWDAVHGWANTFGMSVRGTRSMPEFRTAWHEFRDRGEPWQERRDIADTDFGWEWDEETHSFRKTRT